MTVEDHINKICESGDNLQITITRELITVSIKTINGRHVAKVPRDRSDEDVSEKLARLLSLAYVEDNGYYFTLDTSKEPS